VFCSTPGTEFKSIVNDVLCCVGVGKALLFRVRVGLGKTPPQVADVGVKRILRDDAQFTVGGRIDFFLNVKACTISAPSQHYGRSRVQPFALNFCPDQARRRASNRERQRLE
jgi:hypothetical protein